MPFSVLSSRALLDVSGRDCMIFLHGLVTANVIKLEERKTAYAALLSPQGKFLHDFFLLKKPGRIIIDCDKARVEDLRKRLVFYKLRADVQIQHLSDTQGVVAVWGEDVVDMAADPRSPMLGWRGIGVLSELIDVCTRQGMQQSDELAYHAMRITLGIPDGAVDLIPDKSLIMEWGFEALHGIDFSKGCYIGQEVTARMKYRANIRKMIHCVRAQSPLPPIGTPILCGEEAVGELRSCTGDVGIALLPLEAVEKGGLTANGMAISATKPAWITTRSDAPSQSR